MPVLQPVLPTDKRTPNLMSEPFFKLRSFPGHVWPPLPASGNARVWSAYQSLTHSQWLAPQSLLEQQLRQIRALLRHCRQQVPYYREQLQAQAIEPDQIRSLTDFQCLPLLHRHDVQQHAGALQARQLPPGMQAAGASSTSGTTGEPLRVLYTNVTRLWWSALFLRDLEWCEMDPRGIIAVIRPLDQQQHNPAPRSLPSWQTGLHELIESGPCHILSTHTEPRQQMRWLLDVQPHYLLSSPSNLAHLATYPEAAKLSRLRAIQAVHEALPEATRQQIESRFGVPLRNTYSCEEAGYLASPCPAGHGLHVHGENVLLEILDDNDQPCLPGQPGRVVLTLLQNYRSPFIRYMIGDIATMGPPCPCGRGLPLLTAIQGKTRPLLLLPNGQRRDPQVLLDLLIAPPLAQAFYQFQLIQESVDFFRLRLLPSPTYRAAIATDLERTVQAHLGFAVTVQVDLVDRIPLHPNGKQSGLIVNC